MGVGDAVTNQITEFQNQARRFFEPQLRTLGLAEDQVRGQNLAELKVSLQTIDKAIEHPESFGTLRMKATVHGFVVVTQESSAVVAVGILPILLERRIQILNRIRQIEVEEDVTKLEEELAKSSADTEKSRRIEDELEAKRKEESRLQQLAAESSRREEDRVEKRLQVELQAKKTAIRQTWLARESVASLIGGLLLLALATTLVVAMFSATPVSEIVSSAFLVILGYFFGNSVRERSAQDGSPGLPANE